MLEEEKEVVKDSHIMSNSKIKYAQKYENLFKSSLMQKRNPRNSFPPKADKQILPTKQLYIIKKPNQFKGFQWHCNKDTNGIFNIQIPVKKVII